MHDLHLGDSCELDAHAGPISCNFGDFGCSTSRTTPCTLSSVHSGQCMSMCRFVCAVRHITLLSGRALCVLRGVVTGEACGVRGAERGPDGKMISAREETAPGPALFWSCAVLHGARCNGGLGGLVRCARCSVDWLGAHLALDLAVAPETSTDESTMLRPSSHVPGEQTPN